MKFFTVILLLAIVSCSQGDKNIDQLIVAFDNAPRSVDPRFALDANSQYLTNLVHCSLIEYTPDGNFKSQIAKSLEWKNDNELHVILRDKVRFSNSSPLTAKDVKATFDFFINHPTETARAASFKELSEIKIISSTQLIFKFNKIDASFIINNLGVGILPEKLAGGKQIKEANELIGCGPYSIISFKNHEIKLEKNSKFFIKSRIPRKDELTIKIVKDEGTRFLKLQKGEVHLIQNVSREKLTRIADYPKLSVVKRLGLNTAYLAFNMRDKIVGNQKVREAISYALDRKSIVKFVLYDMAQVATSLLTPGSDYVIKSELRDLNIEKAKSLLDEAGFKAIGSKPRLVINYKTTTDRTRVTIAKAIVSQLAKVGIQVNLQTLEWGKFKKDVEEGKAQMWSLKWVGFKDPDILRYIFHSDNKTPVGGNRGFYSNLELDQILDKARAIVDINERKKLYFKAQEILENDLPYINLWHEEVFAVMNKSLTGYEVYADGRYQALPMVREK